MIRAILRAQWLSMRMFRVGSGRRGAVFSLVLAVLWYGVWTLIAALVEELMASPMLRQYIETWMPLGFAAICAYWQLAPLASASMGASLDLRKLLLYPVPRHSLFLVEILLRITTCAELLLLLAGTSIGLLRNPDFGEWRALGRVALAMVLFVAFNLCLAAGLRSLIERMLARKGIREILGLVLMLVGVLPRLLMYTGFSSRRLAPLLPAGRILLWPWAAAARCMLGGAPGEPLATGIAALAGWTVAAYFFGRWQFMRSLRYDLQAAQATIAPARERSFTGRLYRLPSLLLPDPLAAIVEKELRSLVRTPRFRMVFVMGFSFGLIVWLPMVLRRHETHSAMSDNFLAVVSVYALTLLGQVTYWNAFGFDGAAAQFYFVAPVPVSRALAAKNIAAAVFIFLEIAAVSIACTVLRLNVSAAKIAEAFLVTAIAALYLLGIGNLGSVNYPRAMNAQRVSAGGARGRSQGLVFLIYPIALLPVFLAYLARYAFSSQIAFYVGLALAGAFGLAVYWMAMESAVLTARNRREMIVTELSRGEGPMITE